MFTTFRFSRQMTTSTTVLGSRVLQTINLPKTSHPRLPIQKGVSTSSHRHHIHTKKNMSMNEYHCIGRGGCSSVWALPIAFTTTSTPTPSKPLDARDFSETDPQDLPLSQIYQRPHVLKRADGDTKRSVTNDMAMHRRFLHSTRLATCRSQSLTHKNCPAPMTRTTPVQI